MRGAEADKERASADQRGRGGGKKKQDRRGNDGTHRKHDDPRHFALVVPTLDEPRRPPPQPRHAPCRSPRLALLRRPFRPRIVRPATLTTAQVRPVHVVRRLLPAGPTGRRRSTLRVGRREAVAVRRMVLLDGRIVPAGLHAEEGRGVRSEGTRPKLARAVLVLGFIVMKRANRSMEEGGTDLVPRRPSGRNPRKHEPTASVSALAPLQTSGGCLPPPSAPSEAKEWKSPRT